MTAEREQGENRKEISFGMFVMGVMAEGLLALGAIPDPATKDLRKDMRHAEAVISTLEMLRDKTKGNLIPEEADSLEQALYELRMLYVSSLKASEDNKDNPARRNDAI